MLEGAQTFNQALCWALVQVVEDPNHQEWPSYHQLDRPNSAEYIGRGERENERISWEGSKMKMDVDDNGRRYGGINGCAFNLVHKNSTHDLSCLSHSKLQTPSLASWTRIAPVSVWIRKWVGDMTRTEETEKLSKEVHLRSMLNRAWTKGPNVIGRNLTCMSSVHWNKHWKNLNIGKRSLTYWRDPRVRWLSNSKHR